MASETGPWSEQQRVEPSPVVLRTSEGGVGDESFFEQIGGHETFLRLVTEFYRGVAAERMTLFLEQYWGGPGTYTERRGHPRLRMRHVPFKVNPDARDRWLTHMRTAVDSLGLSELHEATLWDYLERAAHAMVNTFDE
jgi:hemoglobin